MNALRSAKIMLATTAIFVCSAVVPGDALVRLPAVKDDPVPHREARQTTQQHDSINHHAAVDYCYGGSVIDPATGQARDVYVVCPGDGIEQNLDLG